MSAAPMLTVGRRWSGNVWLLGLVGVSAVVAGYWLPARLSSGESRASHSIVPLSAGAEEKATPQESEVAPADTPTVKPKREGTAFAANSPWPEAPDLYAPLGRLALATAVVLVVLVIFLALIRRFWTNPTAAKNGTIPWQVLGELGLGSRCRLLLVRVGREQVLVGVDNRGISGLAILPTRFADWLDEAPASSGEPDPRPRQGAIVAAMVGEGEQ